MKMLKHLFGKRDKELDVLQEEALQSPLRTDEFRDVDFVCRRIVFGFAYKLAVLPVLQMNVGGVVGDLPAGNRLTGKDAGTVFRLSRADALHGKNLALETFDNGVVGDLSVA